MHTGMGLRDPARSSPKESRDRPDSMLPSLSKGYQSSGGRGRGWMTSRSAVKSFSTLLGRGRSTESTFSWAVECLVIL
jgi:hypothetical protein